MIVGAIDPGVNNFAVGIENLCLDTMHGSDADTALLCGETVFCNNFTLSSAKTSEVTRVLDSLHEYWTMCDTVLVERQMQFRTVINTKAIRIAHHCLSYFELKYPHITAIEYQSSNKTRVLGAPAGLTKPQRKKWSVETATKILTCRGDVSTLVLRESLDKKLDDISDCMLMCLAYGITISRSKSKNKPRVA